MTVGHPFESTKRRELSGINGNIVSSFKTQIAKALQDAFKEISWDLQVSVASRPEVGMLGPLMTFEIMTVDYFACQAVYAFTS